MGFPFDPTAEEPFEKDKGRFMDLIINCRKYFDEEEILLEMNCGICYPERAIQWSK